MNYLKYVLICSNKQISKGCLLHLNLHWKRKSLKKYIELRNNNHILYKTIPTHKISNSTIERDSWRSLMVQENKKHHFQKTVMVTLIHWEMELGALQSDYHIVLVVFLFDLTRDSELRVNSDRINVWSQIHLAVCRNNLQLVWKEIPCYRQHQFQIWILRKLDFQFLQRNFRLNNKFWQYNSLNL